MEMTVKDERKLVEIWLTNAEKSDPFYAPACRASMTHTKRKSIWWQFLSLEIATFMNRRGICCFITVRDWRSRKSSVKRRSS